MMTAQWTNPNTWQIKPSGTGDWEIDYDERILHIPPLGKEEDPFRISSENFRAELFFENRNGELRYKHENVHELLQMHNPAHKFGLYRNMLVVCPRSSEDIQGFNLNDLGELVETSDDIGLLLAAIACGFISVDAKIAIEEQSSNRGVFRPIRVRSDSIIFPVTHKHAAGFIYTERVDLDTFEYHNLVIYTDAHIDKQGLRFRFRREESLSVSVDKIATPQWMDDFKTDYDLIYQPRNVGNFIWKKLGYNVAYMGDRFIVLHTPGVGHSQYMLLEGVWVPIPDARIMKDPNIPQSIRDEHSLFINFTKLQRS